ncbi:transposable element Tcb1 transposase [Trichonephila clavipes]|nr:transposable element Tcb1 transposase [Trichonephila clavipes]
MTAILNLTTSVIEVIRCTVDAIYNVSNQDLHLVADLLESVRKTKTCDLRGRRTQLEVSEELGITQSVISGLWQRFQDDGNVSRCYSAGRSRVTTPNENRYLAVTAKRSRRITASDLSRQFSSANGTTVSRQTE